MNTNKTKRYLTPNEAAALLHISPVTLREWVIKGHLPATTTPGGHRRFLRSDVEAFARRRDGTLSVQSESVSRVLIVDDDDAFSTFLRELLEGPPYDLHVEIARDGFQAGHAVARFRPDVMLVDLRMPGLDGLQVCQQLRADPQFRSLRIIAMTGYKDDPRARQIVTAGAESCIEKPLNEAELFAALRLPYAQPVRTE